MTFDPLKPQLAAAEVNVDQFVNVALRQLDQPDQQAVNALLAGPIPLTYQLSGDNRLLVEPRTGTIVALDRVDLTIAEHPDFSGIGRIYAVISQDKYAAKPAVAAAAADLAHLLGAPPTTTLLTESYSRTPASVAATAADAASWANRILLLTVTPVGRPRHPRASARSRGGVGSAPRPWPRTSSSPGLATTRTTRQPTVAGGSRTCWGPVALGRCEPLAPQSGFRPGQVRPNMVQRVMGHERSRRGGGRRAWGADRGGRGGGRSRRSPIPAQLLPQPFQQCRRFFRVLGGDARGVHVAAG
jgi:hypothetical protein